MAHFIHGKMPLLWLVFVTSCLFFGLDALPVAENESTTIATSIEMETYNSTETDDCNEYEFRCDDGECVGKGLVCDEEKHCRDGSDENKTMCKERICYEKAPFKCIISGQCIPNAWICDGEHDCLYGEDEDVDQCQNNTPPALSDAGDMMNAEQGNMLFRIIESQQPAPKRKRDPNAPPPFRGPTLPPFNPFITPNPKRYND